MKKILSLFIFPLLLFYGCEKNFTEVVDPSSSEQTDNIIVVNLQTPDTVRYADQGTFSTSIELKGAPQTLNVTASLFSDKGDSPIEESQMGITSTTDSTVTFEARFTADTNFVSGRYKINYSASSNLLASKYFYITRIIDNLPPVVSNLVIPDTVSFDEIFTFSIDVYDPNGANDIEKVYYQLYKPDGSLITNSQGISEFPLSDNGDTNDSGDITAGDGIYTMRLAIPTGQPAGVWNFHFSAKDFEGNSSNILIHSVTVQ
jgi:hypothetical protein